MRFYVTQLGGVWSITGSALRELLARGSVTGSHTLEGDGIKELATRFSEAEFQRRCGALPKRFRGSDVILLRPINWTRENYDAALDALARRDWTALRFGL